MDDDGSNGSSGGVILSPPAVVKKIRANPAKRWCFTLNNYTEEELIIIGSKVPELCEKYIIGKEVGESGTPHLQGYIELKSKARPKGLFGIDRIHWEVARGNRMDNDKYCSKEDVWLIKGMPKPLKRLACEDNLYPWQEEIISYIRVDPDERTIFWIYSEDGNRGKTTFCKYLHRSYGAICLGGKSADMKNGIIEYVKNNGHTPEFIVVNIPRSFDRSYISYTGIEEVKDMFFYSGKYEGGMVDGNSPHLIIFANHYPEENKLSKDRWFIRKINDNNVLVKMKES